jgi:hypothetical protein
MTDLRDAARQALEALKYSTPIPQNKLGHEAAITALRAALEQPEQEPELRELLIGAAAMAVAAERKGEYQGASWVADAVLEQQGKEKPRSATSHIGTYYGRKNPALEQPEQDTDCHAQGICQRSGYGIGQPEQVVPYAVWRQGFDAVRKYKEQPEQAEPVAWVITDENINSLEVTSIQRLIDRLKHAHHTDLRVRINGQYEWFEADWIKHLQRTHPPRREWRSLSEEEIDRWTPEIHPVILAIEAALRSKNYG